jgi:hypothetical protein
MAAMIRAAKTSFSQVLPRLMMWIPGKIRAILIFWCNCVQVDRWSAHTIIATLVDVGRHDGGSILSTKVALSAKEELEVFLGGVKDCNEENVRYKVSIKWNWVLLYACTKTYWQGRWTFSKKSIALMSRIGMYVSAKRIFMIHPFLPGIRIIHRWSYRIDAWQIQPNCHRSILYIRAREKRG